jgi:hypothetical protein
LTRSISLTGKFRFADRAVQIFNGFRPVAVEIMLQIDIRDAQFASIPATI